MAVTLAEAQKNVQDDLQAGVIDEFRKSNWILDHLIFDDVVSPTGGGATMTYAYTRLKTQPTAGFRNVNEEYTPQEVTKERHTVDLKIFGGSYQVDRVIANMGGIVSEVELQQSQKIKAAQALFNDTFINGDSAKNAKAFDGLDKALTGSSTEYNAGGSNIIDLSTSAKVTENYMYFLDMIDEFLAGLDGPASFLGMNSKMAAKLRACARRASMYQVTKTDWGTQVESYGNIPFVDLGAKAGTNDDVIGTDNSKGTTSIYAARLGLDGLHGVSMAGVAPIQTWLPDFSTSGAVKTGEVEMLAAIALKTSKAAAVFRDIKVK
ncbi:major capsid protein [Clostridium paraputrificum]|uniref:major capsid protein n=1 Tax=Clostridium paraputrificum TaxID=29363 RepID=UPI0034A157D3